MIDASQIVVTVDKDGRRVTKPTIETVLECMGMLEERLNQRTDAVEERLNQGMGEMEERLN